MRKLYYKFKYTRRRIYSMLTRLGAPVQPDPGARVLIGVRYSVYLPVKGGWRISTTNPEAYRASLFDERRLDERYRLFTSITLPSLLAQSLPMQAGLREAVIYVSEYMPERHLGQLHELARRYDWMKLQPVAETATGYPAPELTGLCATVRLDDDDALATWFLERISGYVAPAYAGKVVTFPKGIRAGLAGQIHLSRMWEPKTAQGLTYIAGPDTAFRTIYQLGSHPNVQRRAPLILDDRPNAYLRTIYGGQDTGGGNNPDKPSLPYEMLVGFGLGAAHLQGLSRMPATGKRRPTAEPERAADVL